MGRRIQALRKQRDMSRAELAERADLTREYIRRLEAGLQDPSLSTLTALAKALGVKVATLVRE